MAPIPSQRPRPGHRPPGPPWQPLPWRRGPRRPSWELNVRPLVRDRQAAAAHGCTHIGKVRTSNQDAYIADRRGGVFVLADGMGGMPRGDLAANTAAGAAYRALVGRGDPTRADVAAAMTGAQAGVRDAARRAPGAWGAATTLDVVVVDGDAVLVGHAGDSRVYRLRDNALQRLTADNLANAVVSAGPDVVPQVAAYARQADDVYLMASDGVSGPVPEGRIAEVLRAFAFRDVASACAALVRAALAAGGPDNATAVVIRI